MSKFTFLQARGIEEAIALSQRYGEESRYVAGGVALMQFLRLGLLQFKYLISLNEIPDLRGVKEEKGWLRIGALATHREVEKSDLVAARNPLLHQVFHSVAFPRVREMGTVGGNLCHADPAQDPPVGLIAAKAEAVVQGPSGSRTVPLDAFFSDYYQTVLAAGEMLVEIRVPVDAGRRGWSYQKFLSRSHEDFSTVSCAVTLWQESSKAPCTDLRIALGSAGPTAVRAAGAEAVLRGRAVTPELIEEAAEVARGEVSPSSDGRGSADYKREMVSLFVRRALLEALDRVA